MLCMNDSAILCLYVILRASFNPFLVSLMFEYGGISIYPSVFSFFNISDAAGLETFSLLAISMDLIVPSLDSFMQNIARR